MDFKEKFRNLDKRPLLPLEIIVLVAVIVAVGLFYFLSKDEQIIVQEPPKNTMKEIIKSLSGSEPGEPISEKLQEDLSGSLPSSDSEEEKQKIIENLTGKK